MKISEQIKNCLDGSGCGECEFWEEETIPVCKGLLQKAYERIKGYEELEEQGKLRIFPCGVGDTVYRINKGAEQPIIPLQVMNFKIFNNDLVQSFKMECADEWNGAYTYKKTDIGRDVFITREQAESALKEMNK